MSSIPSSFDWGLLDAFPIVGILRGIQPEWLEPIIQACIEGGLLNLEITMNTPGAEHLIAKAVRSAEHRMNIGAGTVLTEDDLDRATKSGAAFIVTPVSDLSIIRHCRQRGIPVFPGAMSPEEVARCWDEGADCVKIFPADHLGPEYIKALKGPFPHIKMMPTGGVTPETLEAFARAGADVFGVGTPLFPRAGLEKSDWAGMSIRCRVFVQAWRKIRSSSISFKTGSDSIQ